MFDTKPMSDIEIARQAKVRDIGEIAAKLDIPADALIRYGNDKAKIPASYLKSIEGNEDGKLILVTAISPTPAGEGKTTTSVGLGDGLSRIGKRTAICLREPSLGPCFGMKGGAAGGGYAQVLPMEEINLHFTGDMHAISAANNLLAAMIDNHMYWSNELDIDVRRITWKRAIDMNDRSLRKITSAQGGIANGFPQEAGFDIAVASEVMAIFCLATDLDDLQRRLGNIIIGYTRGRKPVYARDIKAEGAMTALLKDAFQPNMVQTIEGTPSFIHGGPFANIAHGCNTVMATKSALKMADYVVTEAGFGSDLGAEKFFDIKCRKAGLNPSTVVLVATVRALKSHGGVPVKELGAENLDAVKKGAVNLQRHIKNLQRFGVPVTVAINHFPTDTDAEVAIVKSLCDAEGVEAFDCTHWANGGAGTEALANHVVNMIDGFDNKGLQPLYADDTKLWSKISTIATKIYGASEITADKKVRDQIAKLQEDGFGHYPVCIAKTQYSFSTDPQLKGAPSDHVVTIREVHLAAGAEFLVVVCGDIMRMPGLPRVPAAEGIGVNENGEIFGLF